MGKSEKLVVLSVLLVVVLLFVWSLQGDGGATASGHGGPGGGGVYASESGSATEPRMNQRADRGKGQRPTDASPTGTSPEVAASTPSEGGSMRSQGEDVASAPGPAASQSSTRLLLAETQPASTVEVQSVRARRQGYPQGTSTLADPAPRSEETAGATSRNGVSQGRIRMQPGWDLVTTAGLQGTVDPAMFLYSVTSADATWEALAKDLYGDEAKAGLLRHNNEGLDVPKGPVFVPAKDDLGRDASVFTVEVLQGESLWQVAKRTLGKGSEWKAVFEANRDVIADPDFVAPGTILKIPVR